ncbi:MAG: hypothetical protein GY749_49140 [Desulfobacteraceae bacterium]|nr:hypothetical protein [Desulfobacteraceae bacterium]
MKRIIHFMEITDMSSPLDELNNIELINLERLAHTLRALTPAELETLEILLDQDASETIRQSIKELDSGERIPITDNSRNL